MKPLHILILLIIPAIFSCKSTNKVKTTLNHPNIVCLVVEDISPYLGCYGDSIAYTPNLDKLASQGIRFNRMFSVYGVCAPSRNALITGMYPNSIGGNNMRTNNIMYVKNMPDSLQIPPYECTPPAEVKCFTEYLRAAGYYCTNNEKEDYQFKAPKSAWDESSRKAHWRNRPEGQPFFSIFNFMRSHESQVWACRGEPLSVHPDSVEIPPYFPDTEEVRKDIAQMHTNNTIMDREIQEIIDQLEEDKLLEKTIIIFYADHGGPLPRGKREILETGTRVPFLVRFPDGYLKGTENDDLCSFVDIPPTILSLAGVKIPEYMQGQAFLGEQKSEPREFIYTARDRMGEWFDCRRAIRDERFRYVRNFRPEFGAYLDLDYRKQMSTMRELLYLKDKNQLNENQLYWFRTSKQQEELYDLDSDPFELHNLAEDPAYTDKKTELRTTLNKWLEDIDDKSIKYPTEKELLESMWPDQVQPVTENPAIKIQDNIFSADCTTEGASLVYQVNNKGLNKDHWFLYTNPVSMCKGDTISVIAHRIGFKESECITVINNN